MTGWVKLNRSITEHWLWNDGEPFSKGQAWVDLFTQANFKPTTISIKGKLINIGAGETARSEVTLAKDWKWSRGKVRRFLEKLKNERMIEQRAVQVTSVITICNYKAFQVSDTAGGTVDGTAHGTVGGTDAVQYTVHKQEGKKERRKETTLKDLSASPPVNQDVEDVFNYWVTAMGKATSTKLNPKRTKLIKARLKDGYSTDDIKKAVDGCKNSPFHMGDNDNGSKYNDIDLICRDGSKVESFIDANSRTPAPNNSGPSLMGLTAPQPEPLNSNLIEGEIQDAF